MNKYKIELNKNSDDLQESLNISESFDNKLIEKFYEIIKRDTKEYSCSETVSELSSICSNDNEFAYVCIQAGRVLETPEIELEIIKMINKKRSLN